MTTTETIDDLLPAQESYYLLCDGVKYARHGTAESNGMLVFMTREDADKFCKAVGCGLPKFRPVRLTARDFFEVLAAVGAFCVVDGLKVTVATLKSKLAPSEGSDKEVQGD